MSRRRAKPAARQVPLDARPAEEIAAAVKKAARRNVRVGDIVPNEDEKDGGEVLVIATCADGYQSVPMALATMVLGALEIRKARRA